MSISQKNKDVINSDESNNACTDVCNFQVWSIMCKMCELLQEINMILESNDIENLQETIKNIIAGDITYTSPKHLIKWNRDIVANLCYSITTEKYFSNVFKELLKLSNELDDYMIV